MGYVEDVYGFGDKIQAWAEEGWAAARRRLDESWDALEMAPEAAKKRAAAADTNLFNMRCSLHYMAALMKNAPDERARQEMRKIMGPVYKEYVISASAMYGSVEAARAHYMELGGCKLKYEDGTDIIEGEIGFLAAVPVAAWYAAAAVVTVAAIAYAWSWDSAEAVKKAYAASDRMNALGSCIRNGGTVESCERVGTPTRAESTPTGVAETLRAAGEAGKGAGAAASGTGVGLGVAALGLAALGGAYYLWNQK